MNTVLSKLILALSIALSLAFASCNDDPPPSSGIMPEADFEFTSPTGKAPVQVNFTNLSKNADTYLWVFNDQDLSTEENPSYEFEYGGSLSVTLIATNDFGSDTLVKPISINHTYATFDIDSMTMFRYSSTKANGEPWDDLPGDGANADVYFILLNEQGDTLLKGRGGEAPDKGPNSVGTWAFYIPGFTNYNEVFSLKFFDKDLVPSLDEFMGEIKFSGNDFAANKYQRYYPFTSSTGIEGRFVLIWK